VIVTSICICLFLATHAPGWSDPVSCIQVPSDYEQESGLEVTGGNHVHQAWSDYLSATRIGRNIVLPDGTFLLEDTLFSRNSWSAYPAVCELGGGLVGVWREYTPIWYAATDAQGALVVPPTLFSTMGYPSIPRMSCSADSLGRVHLTYEGPAGCCYSVFDPLTGTESFRDTIPNSWRYSKVFVDGDRVHVLYTSPNPEQFPEYIQYDLDGNVTVGPVDFISSSADDVWITWGLAADADGNACIFVRETHDTMTWLKFYKIDGETGAILVDGKIIYQENWSLYTNYLTMLPGPGRLCFYLLWTEPDSDGGFTRFIKFAVTDVDGNLMDTPYAAYNYTDEYPEQLENLHAAVNDQGDVFAHWSAATPGEGYYLTLGWFDHNWLGIGDDSASTAGPTLLLSSSCNPFSSSVTISCEGEALPGQLMVYDITGRLIRSLSDREGSLFLWDGRDGSGSEVPTGTYLIQGAVDGQVSSIRAVKL
jgi:hypothetical protein